MQPSHLQIGTLQYIALLFLGLDKLSKDTHEHYVFFGLMTEKGLIPLSIIIFIVPLPFLFPSPIWHRWRIVILRSDICQNGDRGRARRRIFLAPLLEGVTGPLYHSVGRRLADSAKEKSKKKRFNRLPPVTQFFGIDGGVITWLIHTTDILRICDD